MDQWITAKSSVKGASHHKTGLPCQDASVIKVDPSGEWMIVVVSDGAGTATRAEEGSALVVDIFSRALLELSSELVTRKPGNWINDFVIEKVLEVRRVLRKKANSDDIRDFNCTLVACLLGPNGGFSIHIGDGAVFGGKVVSGQPLLHDLSDEHLFISPPENGEYTNETYFVTESDWVKHLRITRMPSLDWIFACTDGGTALALVSDKEPKAGFVAPTLKEVLQQLSIPDRDAKLKEILEDPKADKTTGDDKTIVIACYARNKELIMSAIMCEPSVKPIPTDPPRVSDGSAPLIAAATPADQSLHIVFSRATIRRILGVSAVIVLVLILLLFVQDQSRRSPALKTIIPGHDVKEDKHEERELLPVSPRESIQHKSNLSAGNPAVIAKEADATDKKQHTDSAINPEKKPAQPRKPSSTPHKVTSTTTPVEMDESQKEEPGLPGSKK